MMRGPLLICLVVGISACGDNGPTEVEYACSANSSGGMLGAWVGSVGAQSVSAEFRRMDSVPRLWGADMAIAATVVIAGSEVWTGAGGLYCRYGSVSAELTLGEDHAWLDVERDEFTGFRATAASGVFRVSGVESPVLLTRPQ
jgi:hypothetical protein